MAITIPATGPGTALPIVATEAISATHFQQFKLIDSNAGSLAPLATSANPLFAQFAFPQSIVGSVFIIASSGTQVEGDTAAGSFDDPTFNPIKIGGYASDSVSPTRVGSGARVSGWFDATGREMVRPFAPRGLVVDQITTLNSSAQTVVMTSGTANIFYDLTGVWVTNRSPLPVRVDFRDSSASAVHFEVTVPGSAPGAIQTIDLPLLMPIQQLNAAQALGWTAQLGSGSTVSISVSDVRVFVQAIKVTG